MEDNIKGMMIGAAIGDALGYPLEIMGNKNTDGTKIQNVQTFTDWIRVHKNRYFKCTEEIKAGTYSDDTQLTLCVSRSYKNGIFSPQTMALELSEWLAYQTGGGRAVKAAAKNINFKNADESIWYKNFYEGYTYSGGNGALMRITPHIAANVKNKEFTAGLKNAIKDCLITHGHPHAIIAQIFYFTFLWVLTNKLPAEKAFKVAKEECVARNLGKMELVPDEWFQKYLENNGCSYEKIEEITMKEFLNKALIVENAIKSNMPEKNLYEKLQATGKFKGSGINTALAAAYTVIKNDRSSFAETVLIPANIFQCDTDTTACVAGAAKGLILGLAGIEKTLVSTLQDTEYIKLCAQALYNGSGHHAFQPSLTDKPLEYYRKNLTEINHGEVLKTRLFGSAVIVEKNMNETLLTARIKTQNPEFTLIIKKIPK